jgi:hypothetical protein
VYKEAATLETSKQEKNALYKPMLVLYMAVITIPSGSIQVEFEFEILCLLVEHH